MDDFPRKLKHLEFIQVTIVRMAVNSFLLKGWAVTLVAALFALAAKDTNSKYFIVAYLPVIIFWVLDGYYLYQERRFRCLYDAVRVQEEADIDFSMNTHKLPPSKDGWTGTMAAPTLLLFYLPLLGLMIGISVLMR